MSTNPLFSTTRSIVAMAVAAALLLLAIVAGRSWLASRDAAAQLAATVAAQKKRLDDADAREHDRDAALARSIASIAKAKAAVKTPADAAIQIPQVLPPLPMPITIEMPRPRSIESADRNSASADSGTEAPVASSSPPAIASIPQVDLVPLYGFIQDCRACQQRLTTTEADLTDERTKVAALTAERNAAVKAAHGGGFWSRAKNAAKWLALGGAVGALAVAAGRH